MWKRIKAWFWGSHSWYYHPHPWGPLRRECLHCGAVQTRPTPADKWRDDYSDHDALLRMLDGVERRAWGDD